MVGASPADLDQKKNNTISHTKPVSVAQALHFPKISTNYELKLIEIFLQVWRLVESNYQLPKTQMSPLQQMASHYTHGKTLAFLASQFEAKKNSQNYYIIFAETSSNPQCSQTNQEN